MADKKSPEAVKNEQVRKDRVRFRLFIVLLIFDILLVGYLVFEMISIFTRSK